MSSVQPLEPGAPLVVGDGPQPPVSATAVTLRPYQEEALDAIAEARGRGVRRMLVALPTGAGKTIVFSELIRRRDGGRALVLAHRDELLDQAGKKIRSASPGVAVGMVKAERDEHDRQVVVASVQTLSRPARLARLTMDFSIVVVDEAHHAPAESYRRVLAAVGAFDPAGPLVLGVTATAERGDGVALGSVFEEVVYSRSMLSLIREGFLTDLRGIRIGLDADFSKVRVSHGDLVDADVADALMAADAPSTIAAAYRQHAGARRGLVFLPTVAVAHAMAAALLDVGITAEAVDGTTPDAERKAILGRLRSGATQVVANCAVLTEGFDESSLGCIVVARPTRSKPLWIQMVGRGARLHPGKSDCLVLDVVGVAARHDLVSLATLAGVDPEALERGTVTAALAEKRARKEQEEQERAAGRLVAAPVDLFAQRRRAAALDDPNASWRSRPATEKQVAALERMRIRHDSDLTAGQASDLIAARVARRRAS